MKVTEIDMSRYRDQDNNDKKVKIIVAIVALWLLAVIGDSYTNPSAAGTLVGYTIE